MERSEIDEFLHTYAPADVQDTNAWLSANGYALVAQKGDSTFGAQFVYEGDTEVRITVDRSQWYLVNAADLAHSSMPRVCRLAGRGRRSGRAY
jgi:hypothetical protein